LIDPFKAFEFKPFEFSKFAICNQPVNKLLRDLVVIKIKDLETVELGCSSSESLNAIVCD
jgi:hypothetical protein